MIRGPRDCSVSAVPQPRSHRCDGFDVGKPGRPASGGSGFAGNSHDAKASACVVRAPQYWGGICRVYAEDTQPWPREARPCLGSPMTDGARKASAGDAGRAGTRGAAPTLGALEPIRTEHQAWVAARCRQRIGRCCRGMDSALDGSPVDRLILVHLARPSRRPLQRPMETRVSDSRLSSSTAERRESCSVVPLRTPSRSLKRPGRALRLLHARIRRARESPHPQLSR